MAQETFPCDPCRRRVVLVLDEYDIEKCEYEDGASHILCDDEVHVLRFPVQRNENDPIALRNILDADLARRGNMLIQSPYNSDEYQDASIANECFAVHKHFCFSQLCQILGAREVSIQQIERRSREGKRIVSIDADLKVKRIPIGFHAAYEDEKLAELWSQLHLNHEFSGGAPNIEAAEELILRKGLRCDRAMCSLIELRRNGKNPLAQHSLRLNLSSETERSFRIIGRLQVPFFISLSAEYSQFSRDLHEYTLTTCVRF